MVTASKQKEANLDKLIMQVKLTSNITDLRHEEAGTMTQISNLHYTVSRMPK